MLENEDLDLATIRQVRDSFAAQARETLPAGQIVDATAEVEEEEEEESEVEDRAPAAAYVS